MEFGAERKPSQSELEYFRANTGVGGYMHPETKTIVLNPFAAHPDGTPFSPEEFEAIKQNERARLALHFNLGGNPVPPGKAGSKRLPGYPGTPQNEADSILARMFSGDPSGGKPSLQQGAFLDTASPILRALFRGMN